jgi:hypothetical protein
MAKKGLYIILLLVCIDIAMACIKRPGKQHCTTSIVDMTLQNVTLNGGSIYGTPIVSGGAGLSSEPVAHETYAIKIDLVDSVKSCEKLAYQAPQGLIINNAFAYDPVISAHTTDRIKKISVLINNLGNTFLPGDTMNDNRIKFHTYLLEHRHDNLTNQEAINAYNNFLQLGSTGDFYAGDYLPKLYIKLKDPIFVGFPVAFRVVIEMESGAVMSKSSDEVMIGL